MKILLDRNTKLVDAGSGLEPAPGTVLLASLAIAESDGIARNVVKRIPTLGVVVAHKQAGDEDTYSALLLTSALGDPAYLSSDDGFRYSDAAKVLPGCKILVRGLRIVSDSEQRNLAGQICVAPEGLLLLCARPNEAQSIKALNLLTWRLEAPPPNLYRQDIWFGSWELVCIDERGNETVIVKHLPVLSA